MKTLKFKEEPSLDQLAGLEINGHAFVKTEVGANTMFNTTIFHIVIPEAFRFVTNLEVLNSQGEFYLVATQALTRSWEYWEMERDQAIHRINFNDDDKTGDKMQIIVDELLRRDLVEWEEI
ncbi:hypothetical protein [Listeria booriae]|uniref:hypothetical protein n=1 Tax=Listeria booriae TaxID=1552123 RepID=UPI001625BAFD|nr:hypothetical protein [Listeria booriae]MBC2174770.1 hypothetical protein [Listeria booriae]